MAGKALETYLNDHLAGAMLGSSLARRLAEEHRDEPLGRMLGELATEIEEDRRTLMTVMRRVGATRNPAKQASTWATEQLSRIKFAGATLRGKADLGTFMALETLVLGISGKAALWRALGDARDAHPGLREFDFDALAASAVRQRDRVERQRRRAASDALAGI